MGISFYVLAAMCGNFSVESNVNAGIYEGLQVIPDEDMTDNSVYGGYGIGQWTNKESIGLTRRTQLIEWLNQNNYEWDDPYGQLDYLIYEDYWSPNIATTVYPTLTSFLESTSTNVSYLTTVWMRNWEGINNGTLKKRQSFAKKALAYIQEHYDDETIDTWTIGNMYLSEKQMLNNSVLLARYLTGGIKPPKAKNKMPLWMYLRRL